MALIEHSSQERMRREEAAQRLRDLADELSRQNEVSFVKEGMRVTVPVPDEVVLHVEVEAGGDENEIEIEITW